MNISLPTDNIKDHMATLEEYADRAGVLIEIGCEYGTGSTWAFRRSMEKNPNGRLWISVDIKCQIDKLLQPAFPFWNFILGDSRSIEVIGAAGSILGDRMADLIFIDTVHEYDFLKQELSMWRRVSSPNCTWLLHDTYMNGTYNHMTDAAKEFAAYNGLRFYDISTQCHGLSAISR